jgi:hypothetical protein
MILKEFCSRKALQCLGRPQNVILLRTVSLSES